MPQTRQGKRKMLPRHLKVIFVHSWVSFSLSFHSLTLLLSLFRPFYSLHPLGRPSPSVVWVRQAARVSPDLPNSLQTPCCKASDKKPRRSPSY